MFNLNAQKTDKLFLNAKHIAQTVIRERFNRVDYSTILEIFL